MKVLISLKKLTIFVWKNILVFIAVALVGSGVGYLIGKVSYQPYYIATSQITFHPEHIKKVKNKADRKSNQIIADASALGVHRIQAIDNSTLKLMVKYVASKTGYKVTQEQMKSMLTFEGTPDSLTMIIHARSTDKKLATAISNSMATFFQKRVQVYNRSLKHAHPRVSELAAVPIFPANQPNTTKYAAYGAISGMLIGMIGMLILKRNKYFSKLER